MNKKETDGKIDYRDMVECVIDSLFEEIGQDEAKLATVMDHIQTNRSTLRLYYIHPSLVDREYWGPIREHESLCDIFIGTTINFLFRLTTTYPYGDYVNSCGVLANAILSAPGSSSDELFREPMATATELKNMIEGNPWLVVLILLERNLNYLKQRMTPPAPTQGT